MNLQYDDAVVGAGVIGLAHAYHLAKKGRKVVVFERNPRASGASVRNFGMLWPIGQSSGEMLDMANRSLEHWRELLNSSGIWHDTSGSLHLAYHDDEAEVLREFVVNSTALGYRCKLVNADNIGEYSYSVNPQRLKLALWSSTEVCVDPRQVMSELPKWLSNNLNVTFHYSTPVTSVCGSTVVAAGKEWLASRIWICTGDDFQSLLPEIFAESGLYRCKLQMMRTKPLEGNWQLGPMLAAGLTLRHYKSFERCQSLSAVKERVTAENPEYDRLGIHVMVSQHGTGEVTIGDSHEYGADVSPFNSETIDLLILTYLKTFLRVPEITINERWNGTYGKHATHGYYINRLKNNCTIATGIGGAGMTLSFGFAEKCISETL